MDPFAFSCPGRRTGDDIDHVLEPPEPPADAWGDEAMPIERGSAGERGAVDPFLRYRRLLYPYRLHRAWGGDDAGYVALVEGLQRAVADVDGRRFAVTPVAAWPASGLVGDGATGRVWVKDETGNVSGSHKGRHLFGLALYLRVVDTAAARLDRSTGIGQSGGSGRRLAISSCGNAALAAAVVAAAIGAPLDVFVPTDAAPSVLARLGELGACVQVCGRVPGERGDPCFNRFIDAVAEGALPFATQGPENGLTIDGAATVGYELADQLASVDAEVQRVYVQVGGGALGAAVAAGLRRAHQRGVLPVLPALHPTQTEGAAPLARAQAAVVAAAETGMAFDEALAGLAQRRSRAMWPWEVAPHGAAHGILDDETYDWRSLLTETAASGGRPLVATEAEVLEANDRARAVTGIDADHTGTAGLAGLLHHVRNSREGELAGDAVVLFTGHRR